MSNRWIAGRLGLSEKAVRKSLPRLGWKPGPEASLSFLPEAGHTAIAYIDGRTSTDSGFEIAEEKSRMEIDKATSRIRLAQEVLDEVFGLGPLEPLLADPTISDILVNTYKHVYIERKGMLEATSVQFRDDIHLMGIIDRIVSAIGRRVDESSPMVDVRLADGSRVNAIIPPLAVDGPCLSIRRFGRDPLTADDLLSNNSLTGPMLDLMRGCVKARLNVLISGGYRRGQDDLPQRPFIVHFQPRTHCNDRRRSRAATASRTRCSPRNTPPNIEGKGAIHQRQLVINSLRMRPDRIIVGEVRSEEALDMLQAMNTGHDGSLTTIHANTPRDALGRLETMVAMASLNIPESAIRRQISSAIDVVVSRLSDGTRKIVSLAEITGMEGEVLGVYRRGQLWGF